jgi:hypothetical protein
MERQMTMAKTLTEADLGALELEYGAHMRRQDGVCLMEAVAWFAGKEHTDRPPCVSPVLGAFGRALNDRMKPEDRQQLKRFIPVLPGTAGNPDADRARAWLAADWLVRTALVAWLDAAGLADDATAVQELDPVLSYEALEDARPVLRRARDGARVVYDAVWTRLGARAAVAVAADVADVAAAVAAADVADVAAAAAAVAADVAAAAAVAAARRQKIYEAVRQAAGERLQPVVSRLQASALDLFGRMIETTRAD